MPKFKTRIHEFRKEMNLQQADLAEMVGVRRETIGKLENGKYNPSLKLAIDIARVFGRSVEEVFIFEDEKKKIPSWVRIVVLLCALAIPVMYVTTLILFALGDPKGTVFMAISLSASFFLMPVMYAVTKLPRDVVETYYNIVDMAKEDDRKGWKKRRRLS